MRKTMILPILLVLVLSTLLSACTPDTAAPAETKTFAPVVMSSTEAVAETPPPAQVTELPAQPAETQTVAETESQTPAETAPSAAQFKVFQIVPGESKVRYEVGETFFSQNNRFNLAIGVTPQVSGEVRNRYERPAQG